MPETINDSETFEPYVPPPFEPPQVWAPPAVSTWVRRHFQLPLGISQPDPLVPLEPDPLEP